MSAALLVERLLPVERVTSFQSVAVGDEALLGLLQTARLAPSANNKQIWWFSLIRDTALIEAAARRAGLTECAAAPVLIAAQAAPGWIKRLHKEQPFFMIDVPIAMSHLSLAAREKDLAIEWVFPPEERGLQDLLGLERGRRLVALGFCGRPAGFAPRSDVPKRVFLNEIEL